jgi:hypothetical protein
MVCQLILKIFMIMVLKIKIKRHKLEKKNTFSLFLKIN